MKIENYKFFILNFLIIVLLNFPKIDLLPVPGMAQGIRVDDFLIVGLFVYIILNKNIKFKIPIFILCIYAYIFFSNFLGIAFHPGNNDIRIVYIIRGFEYFIAVLVFYNFKEFLIIKNILYATLLIQGALVMEQMFHGILRPYGSYNGPWELVTVVALLSLFYASNVDNKNKNKNKNIFIFIPLFFSIVSQSRSSTLGLLTGILFNGKKLRHYIVLIAVLFTSAPIIFLFINSFNWLASVFNPENIVLVSSFIEDIVSGRTDDLFLEFKLIADPSLAARLSMWLELIFLYYESEYIFLKIFFGIGIGSKSIIIDGFYIRLLFELGIVGTFGYFFVLYRLWKENVFRVLVIFMSFTCLTLDPYSSSKIIYTLGVLYAIKKSKIKT